MSTRTRPTTTSVDKVLWWLRSLNARDALDGVGSEDSSRVGPEEWPPRPAGARLPLDVREPTRPRTGPAADGVAVPRPRLHGLRLADRRGQRPGARPPSGFFLERIPLPGGLHRLPGDVLPLRVLHGGHCRRGGGAAPGTKAVRARRPRGGERELLPDRPVVVVRGDGGGAPPDHGHSVRGGRTVRLAGPRIRLATRDPVRPPDDGHRRPRTVAGIPPEPRPAERAVGRAPEGRPRHRSCLPPPLFRGPCPVRVRDPRRPGELRMGGRRGPVLARPQRTGVRRARDPRRDVVPLCTRERSRVRVQLAGIEPSVDPLGARSRNTRRTSSGGASVLIPRG